MGKMTNKQKIIIDCDPGIDDALAITLLVKSNLFNIKAITTVAGNCTLKETTNNAVYIKNQLGSSFPVFSGSQKPLKKKLVTANVHGVGGLAGLTSFQNNKLKQDAIEQVIHLVQKYPGQITILAIGPLTNIAKLLKKLPKAKELIKQIVIMGGAVEKAGNQTKYAEFNMFVDPDAAKIVFASKVEKVLVPLEVCNMTTLKLKDLNDRKSFLYHLMREYQRGLRTYSNLKKIVAYDAVAAYYLINPQSFQLRRCTIDIKTSGLRLGKTTNAKNDRGTTLLAKTINSRVFQKDFLKIVKGGENNDRKRSKRTATIL